MAYTANMRGANFFERNYNTDNHEMQHREPTVIKAEIVNSGVQQGGEDSRPGVGLSYIRVALPNTHSQRNSHQQHSNDVTQLAFSPGERMCLSN